MSSSIFLRSSASSRSCSTSSSRESAFSSAFFLSSSISDLSSDFSISSFEIFSRISFSVCIFFRVPFIFKAV